MGLQLHMKDQIWLVSPAMYSCLWYEDGGWIVVRLDCKDGGPGWQVTMLVQSIDGFYCGVSAKGFRVVRRAGERRLKSGVNEVACKRASTARNEQTQWSC